MAAAVRAAEQDHLRMVTLEPELLLPIELVWREDDDSPLLRTFLEAVG